MIHAGGSRGHTAQKQESECEGIGGGGICRKYLIQIPFSSKLRTDMPRVLLWC